MTSRKFQVRVKPKASKNEVIGWEDGVLHVQVKAPPVDGAANRGLIKLLAGYFDIPSANVEIIRGKKSRLKHVKIFSDKLHG